MEHFIRMDSGDMGMYLLVKDTRISKVVTTRTQFAFTVPCAARNACIGGDALECLNISYPGKCKTSRYQCKLSE